MYTTKGGFGVECLVVGSVDASAIAVDPADAGIDLVDGGGDRDERTPAAQRDHLSRNGINSGDC
jgi:hypothetical protein